jgi:hypothetical protein
MDYPLMMLIPVIPKFGKHTSFENVSADSSVIPIGI